MKNLLSALILLVFTACVYAQTEELAAPHALDMEGERSRIQAQRARQEVSDRQKEAACYARFAVNDCLRAVRVQRRAVLDDLRHQELLLNDTQRKQRAMDRLDRIDEKLSSER